VPELPLQHKRNSTIRNTLLQESLLTLAIVGGKKEGEGS